MRVNGPASKKGSQKHHQSAKSPVAGPATKPQQVEHRWGSREGLTENKNIMLVRYMDRAGAGTNRGPKGNQQG